MKTNMNCIRVIFEARCRVCGEGINGGTPDKDVIYSVPISDILENGAPICSCGTDFEWTDEVEVLV